MAYSKQLSNTQPFYLSLCYLKYLLLIAPHDKMSILSWF